MEAHNVSCTTLMDLIDDKNKFSYPSEEKKDNDDDSS